MFKEININSIKTRKKTVDIKDIEDSENNRLLDDDDFRVLYPCLRKNHISLLVGNHIFIYGGIDSNILN